MKLAAASLVFATLGSVLPSEAYVQSKASFLSLASTSEGDDPEAPSAAVRGRQPPPNTWIPSDSSLQKELNKECARLYDQLCKRGDVAFCNQETVARFDVGNESQTEPTWRCYHKSSLSYSLVGDSCVDHCGRLSVCYGVVEGKFSQDHSTDANENLQKIIKEKAEAHCDRYVDYKEERRRKELPISILQGILDNACNELFAEKCKINPHFCHTAVARNSVGREGEGKAWRCYNSNFLEWTKETPGCVDSCNRETSCRGGVQGETSREQLGYSEELVKLITDLHENTCKMNIKKF